MTIADIIADFNKKAKVSVGTSYQSSDFLVDVNAAFDRVSSLILKAQNSRWEWDDFNNTDLPIAISGLVSGQKDYSLDISFLTIDRVEIQDSTGTWHLLDPVSQQDLKRGSEVALENFLPNSNVPQKYEPLGNSIFLYPTPNYTLAGGLKVYFTRGPNYFVIGDIPSGTKVPGFNALFHQLLSLWPAYDYCISNLPELANGYMQKIQLLEASINDFYGLREHDERPRFTVSTSNGGGSQSGVLGWIGGGDSNR